MSVLLKLSLRSVVFSCLQFAQSCFKMLKNPLYQYGSPDLQLPVNLNFSEFILNKLVEFKHKSIVNGVTEETITYGEVAQQSMNLAISLARLGVRKGQTVGICSENRTEFFSAVVGSLCTGAVFTTFNMMYTKNEISHVASISQPKYIISSPLAYKMHQKTFKSLKFIEKIIIFGDERPPGTISFNDLVSAQTVRFEEFRTADVDSPEEALFVLYSSGTTGLPKGVVLTHRNVLICCNAKGIETPIPVKYLLITPWFHTMGLMGSLLYLASGRDLVYLPKFEIELYLKCIEKYKITRISVVPPVLVALVKYPNKYDLSSVDIIYSGAAPLTKETAEAVKTKFPNVKMVLQGYGMTETTLAITRDSDESALSKVGGVGTVVPGAIIKIIDLKTRKPLGVNQPGEICVKGGLVMKGYVGKDRKDDFDDEGFFRTGDIGYYDEDRYFFIVDRLKELIKYKGFQVAPAEIEAVLLQHVAVRDAGVVGVPDARAGELPRAFVALQPGASATAEELQAFVAERVSHLMSQVAPAEIEAVLLQHMAVRDAGVVGAPDARAGELPRAFVALQPGASATAEELQAFVAERVSHLMSQVAPAEIEAVLLQHVAVRDAGVVGAPDARAGELPRAFVALQPGASATAEELQAFVAERVSHLMSQVAPAEIEAVLLQHVAVRDAGVVGAPDARAGELPRAFDALQPGASATAEELQAFVAERVSHLMSQVAPAEIEAVLLQHVAVRDAGVVGAPDARAGELPRAFDALQPGASATAEELQEFVAKRLSNPKWLRGGVRFVPEIPKNPSGKILRRELRALAQRKSKL